MSGRGKHFASGLMWSLGGFYYQFITTKNNNTIGGDGEFVNTTATGSAVDVRFKNKATIEEVDFDELRYKATGSTIEVFPIDHQPIDDINLITKVKNIQQNVLIPEYIYRYYTNLDEHDNYKQLGCSWSSRSGHIYNAGFFMLTDYFKTTDIGYDLPPTTINGGTVRRKMIDADWPNNACMVTVENIEFGNRTFIIVQCANSKFYCWPTIYESDESLVPPDSPYLDQAIFVNVDPALAKEVIPPYPAWVYVPVGDRRDTDFPSGTTTGEPKYTWRFHPQGTKVVGIVLSRTAFETKVYGRAYPDDSDLKFKQVELGDMECNPNSFGAFHSSYEYDGPIKNDLPGFVEFSLDISITGPNPTDFTFGMTLTREQAADSTHYIIAADYLNPIIGGWASYSIAGSAGDLVVLDLASYVDDRGLLQIKRNCGYLGRTSHKVRQTWATVINWETSTSLLNFLVKDQPSDYEIERFYLNAPDKTVNTSRFTHIDLRFLSFSQTLKKSVYHIDSGTYADLGENVDPFNPGSTLCKLKQRYERIESGIRYYVFGQKVNEARNGEDLDLFTTFDAITFQAGMTRISPLSTGTRWLESSRSGFFPKHWLLGDNFLMPCLDATRPTEPTSTATIDVYVGSGGSLAIISGYNEFGLPIYVAAPTGIIGDQTNDELIENTVDAVSNYLLLGMKNLSSSTTGPDFCSYHKQEFAYEESPRDINFYGYFGTTGPPDYEPIYRNGVFEYTTYVTANLAVIECNTDIASQIPVQCQDCDSDYFLDTFVPWAQEIYQRELDIITSINYSATYYTYRVQLINELFYYDSLSNEAGICQSSTTEEHGPFILYGFGVDVESGYRPNFVLYGIQMRDLMVVDTPQSTTYPEDACLATSFLDNIHQRVYNYPIGAEWMMNEWLSVYDETDYGFSLTCCPEGFYAGQIWLPGISGSVSSGSLFVSKDYSKIPYVLPNENNWALYYGRKCRVAHAAINDYVMGGASANNPNSNQISFTNVDIIGCVNGEQTSHSIAYEFAFGTQLDIANPSKSILQSESYYTEIAYFYKRGENIDGDTEWVNIFDEQNRICSNKLGSIGYMSFPLPLFNGSMVFLKN